MANNGLGTRQSPVGEPDPQLTKAPIGKLAALSPFGVLLFFFIGGVSNGLPALDGFTALVVVVVTQVVPGILLWRLVRSSEGLLVEDIVLGFAVGTGLSVLSLVVATATGVAWLSLTVGPAIAAVVLSAQTSRKRVLRVRTARLPGSWYLSTSAITLLLLRQTEAFYRMTPHNWSEGFAAAYVDMPFHLAIAGQLAQRGPIEMPHLLGEPLHYHWFSHAWVAQVSEAAAIPLDVVLYRFLPSLIPVVVVFAIAAVGHRLGGNLWTGPLAAFIAVAASDLPILTITRETGVVHHLSPGFALSSIVSLALVALLVARLKSEASNGSYLMVVFLAVTAVGMKASSLTVIAGGVGLAVLVGWLRGWATRKILLFDLLLLSGALGIAMVALFGLRSGGFGFDPVAALASRGSSGVLANAVGLETFWLVVLAAIVFLVSVGAKAAGFFGLITQRRLDSPTVVLLVGMALAGLSAVLLLDHSGGSQWYFLWGAVPALAIGSSMGLLALWDGLSQRRVLLRFGLGAGCVLVSIWLIGLSIRTRSENSMILLIVVGSLVMMALTVAVAANVARLTVPSSGSAGVVFVVAIGLIAAAILPTAAVQLGTALPETRVGVAPGSVYSFSSDQIDAARWIKANSGEYDVVATNRHCTSVSSDVCDARRFYVAAYTERRVLVEGWAYTPTWLSSTTSMRQQARFAPFWDPELLSLNDEFFQAPGHEGAERLRDEGVDWLYVDKTAPYSRDLGRFANPRFETQWAWIFDLEAAGSG